MNHLKAIFSGMLLSLSVITPGAAAGVSEGTILLSGSVVNAACEVSVLAAEQPQNSQPPFNIAACATESLPVCRTVSLKVNLCRGVCRNQWGVRLTRC